MYNCICSIYYKTLPKSSAIVNRISVRFYESDCIITQQNNTGLIKNTMYFALWFSLQPLVVEDGPEDKGAVQVDWVIHIRPTQYTVRVL